MTGEKKTFNIWFVALQFIHNALIAEILYLDCALYN